MSEQASKRAQYYLFPFSFLPAPQQRPPPHAAFREGGNRKGAPANYRYKGALPPTFPPKTHPHWESWWCCVPLPVQDTLSRLSPLAPAPNPAGPLRADSGILRRVSPLLPLSWKIWPWLR